ncbi:MAG: hypothetical protein ACE5OW_01950 [Candidatus Bathyarchaeia archaeon]
MKSKLKVEKLGVVAFSVFYAVAGGTQAFILVLSNFALVHVGFLAVLSLATAYGLVRMRRWSVFLVAILFFLGTTFGATTLYSSIMQQTFYPSLEMLLFHLALIVYLIMTVVAFIYVATKRKNFH